MTPRRTSIRWLVFLWVLGPSVGIAAAAPETPLVPAAAGCRACVERVGGLPAFVIDGRPNPGVCYSTYDCTPQALARRVGQFAAAGCEIFNFVVELSGYGYSRPLWTARDRWDFTDLDRRARTVLAAAPRAMLLPRIYLDAPAWWRSENRGELMVLGNGSTSFGAKLFALSRPGEYPSLASAKWRADVRQALATVIDHVEGCDYGPRVIGYQLSGQKTEEWYHWSMNAPLLGDYSPHMQRAFRRWLRQEYRTDASLAIAWGRPGLTLAAASIPSQAERFGDRSRTFREPRSERPVIDFHRYWSEIMADTIAELAGTVKQKTGHGKLVGAFYGYTFEFAELGEDAGHLALGRLLRSPHVDFIMAPSSYYDRNLPGRPYFRAPVASVSLHGKLFWDDFDQVSYKYYEKLKADPALRQWEYQMGLTKTPEEFVWMNRREAGMALAQGAQLAHFDIHGGYYEDPAIMEGVRQLAGLRRQALGRPRRAAGAQVLAVVDEPSEHYYTFRNPVLTPLLSGQMAQLGFVAPYDALLLEDLPEADTRGYKLVLVLNAARLDGRQRRTLRQKLAGDGRTVVWLHAPGYFDEHGQAVANMAGVTGIQLAADAASPPGEEADLVGAKPGEPAGIPLLAGEQFRVDDPKAQPLAVRRGGRKSVVLARKSLLSWTSVYSAAAPLPAPFLRRLAAEAGVHLYTHSPDYLVFADNNYLCIAAPQAGGTCEVSLPEPRTIRDFPSGAILQRNSARFPLPLRPREVRVLVLE
jgi:hypothetical protein